MQKRKLVLLVLCAVLLVSASVAGTLAYLISHDETVNVFTVGQVDIKLDEVKVSPDGKPVDGEERVKENKYHLLPGMTYTKDPTITVSGGSEDAYVRMLVTINRSSQLDALFAPSGANLTDIFGGYDNTVWIYEGETRDAAENTITYEFRYKQIVGKTASDTPLEPLFKSLTIPDSFSGDDMKTISGLEIKVVGNAIQTAGFDDEDSAWEAFDVQMKLK